MTSPTPTPATDRDARATIYAPPGPERDALLAECIGSILAGRPLPEAVRPRAAAVERPASVYVGISRILAGR